MSLNSFLIQYFLNIKLKGKFSKDNNYCYCFLFNGVSTFVGYLMLNLSFFFLEG